MLQGLGRYEDAVTVYRGMLRLNPQSRKVLHNIGSQVWQQVEALIREEWSPEQIVGRLEDEQSVCTYAFFLHSGLSATIKNAELTEEGWAMKNNQLVSVLDGSKMLYRFGIIAVALFFSGCVALQPGTTAARSGDTITLAVGAADGMTASNTTVEFFPGPDPDMVAPIPVPIRSIAKIYPDRTSKAWLGDEVLGIPRRSAHGGWLAVVVVDLPTLPEGDGFFRVSTNGEVTYPRFSATPNGTDLPFTILPGSAIPNPFDYAVIDGVYEAGNLGKLAALPQVIVKPPVPAEGAAQSFSYGAIEMDMTISLSSRDGEPVVDDGIAVVLDDQPQNLLNQTQLLWSRTGDSFTIMLVSPKGMYSHESRVSIVPRGGPEYPYDINGTPMLNLITYYDLNGALTSGPMPTVSIIASP